MKRRLTNIDRYIILEAYEHDTLDAVLLLKLDIAVS